MVRPEEIQARLRQRPFRPFRIIASEGLCYEISHPDLMLVGMRDLMIGIARRARPTLYDRVVRLDLSQVLGLEDIPAATTPTANGPSQAS